MHTYALTYARHAHTLSATSKATVSVAQLRAERNRVRFSHERTAKQKMVLKYLREHLKFSDLRIFLSSLSEKAHLQLQRLSKKFLRAGTVLTCLCVLIAQY